MSEEIKQAAKDAADKETKAAKEVWGKSACRNPDVCGVN